MSNNSDNDGFSIKGQIQKRKTQEIQRTILDQQIAKAHGDSAPPSTPTPRPRRVAKRPSQEILPDKRATLVASSVRASRQQQRVALIAGIAASLIVFICAGTLALASNAPSVPEATPTFVPI